MERIDTKRLRAKLLDLAVRGKLVPQDPNDEPASALLERIRAERAELVKQKKAKAPKSGDSVIYRGSDGSHYEKRGKGEPERIDVPFDIPSTWAWARIETIANEPRYGTSKKSSPEGKMPVLRMGNITRVGTIDWGDLVYTSDEDDIAKYSLSSGDIIFNRTNSKEWVGKTAYYDGSYDCIYAGYLVAFTPIEINGRYINYAMCSDYERTWCKAVKTDGVNQSNINVQKLKTFLLPVPPITEQGRIVSVLEKCLSLVDEIEHSQTDLDSLYSQLRSKVLDLAVRGQLVEQSLADEPAAVLLERIREERRALVAAGKAKAPKGGDSIIYRASDGGHYEKRGKKEERVEVPFDLPEGWKWARLGSIVWHRPQVVPDKRFSYIDIGSIDNVNQRLNTKETLIDAKDAPSRARKPVEIDDILYSTVRPYLHNACIIDREFSATPIASTGFAAMVCHGGIINRYLLHVLLSPYFDLYANASGNSTGSSYPAINDVALYRGLIPIPPLAEQQRIVAKIDQLLAALTNQ